EHGRVRHAMAVDAREVEPLPLLAVAVAAIAEGVERANSRRREEPAGHIVPLLRKRAPRQPEGLPHHVRREVALADDPHREVVDRLEVRSVQRVERFKFSGERTGIPRLRRSSSGRYCLHAPPSVPNRSVGQWAEKESAPSGIRTRATTLKGWRPGPLVDGGGPARIAVRWGEEITTREARLRLPRQLDRFVRRAARVGPCRVRRTLLP